MVLALFQPGLHNFWVRTLQYKQVTIYLLEFTTLQLLQRVQVLVTLKQ